MDDHTENPSKPPDDVVKLSMALGVTALLTLEEELKEYDLDLESLNAEQITDLVHSYADPEVEWQFAVAHARAVRTFASRQGLRKREPREKPRLRKLDLREADESP
jgi:hypothetical protein